MKRRQTINGQVILLQTALPYYFGGRIEFSDNMGHDFFVIIIYFLEAYKQVMCPSAVGTDPFFSRYMKMKPILVAARLKA
jgi:hypothetical protein